MLNKLISLTLITLSIGCSSNYHLKQSKRHYSKAIEKGYKPSIDTVFVSDTVFIHQVKHDSVFHDVGDTIIIEKDRLKIKYVRNIITDSVFIEGICEADTIIKEIPIMVQEKIYIETSIYDNLGLDTWWKKAISLLLILLMAILIIWRKISSS